MRNWHKFRSLPHWEKRLLIEASLLLPLTALALRTIGLRRWKITLLAASRITGSYSAIKNGPSLPEAFVAAGLVKKAAWHGIRRANCLEQSLVLWWLLSRRGVESDLQFGVRKGVEFEAHAWVEVGGVPLNESRDVRQRFSTLTYGLLPSNGDQT